MSNTPCIPEVEHYCDAHSVVAVSLMHCRYAGGNSEKIIGRHLQSNGEAAKVYINDKSGLLKYHQGLID